MVTNVEIPPSRLKDYTIDFVVTQLTLLMSSVRLFNVAIWRTRFGRPAFYSILISQWLRLSESIFSSIIIYVTFTVRNVIEYVCGAPVARRHNILQLVGDRGTGYRSD